MSAAARPKEASTQAPRFGPYEIVEKIGEGTLGIVYRARDPHRSACVALKLARLSRPPQAALEVLRREAWLAALVGGPNLVPVYDVGMRNGRPYSTMMLVEGGTLEEYIERLPLGPWRAAPHLIRTLLPALHALGRAHCEGIVHLDVKPSNLLVDGDFVAHLSDFGIAWRIGDPLSREEAAASEGTPLFRSPEQVYGESQKICPASDVYACGIVLYVAFGGRPPNDPPEPGKRARHPSGADHDPLRNHWPEMPRPLEAIIHKAMRLDPADRYADAHALADDLERWLDGLPVAALKEAPPTME